MESLLIKNEQQSNLKNTLININLSILQAVYNININKILIKQ